MSFSPIAFVAPNYRDYKNNWVKPYEPGSPTPKPFALESNGGTQVAKLEINKDGFIVSAGAALVIPFIDGAYDLWMFPTEAEADANDTSNAIRIADDVTAALSQSGLEAALINDQSQAYEFATVDDMVNSPIFFTTNKTLTTKGYQLVGDGGGSSYLVSAAGAADGQVVHTLINGLRAIPVAVNNKVDMRVAGIDGVGNAGDSTRLQNLCNFCKDNGYGVIADKTHRVSITTTVISKVDMDIGILSLDGLTASDQLLIFRDADPVNLIAFKNSATDLVTYSGVIGGLPDGLNGHSMVIISDEVLSVRYQGLFPTPASPSYLKKTSFSISQFDNTGDAIIFPTLDMKFNDRNLITVMEALPPEVPVTINVAEITSSISGSVLGSLYIKRNNTIVNVGRVQGPTSEFNAAVRTEASFLELNGGTFHIDPLGGTGYAYELNLGTDITINDANAQDSVLEQLYSSNVKINDSKFRTLGSHWTNYQVTKSCIMERMAWGGKDLISIDDNYLASGVSGAYCIQIRDDTPEGLGVCRLIRPVTTEYHERLLSFSVTDNPWGRDINLFREILVEDPVIVNLGGIVNITLASYQVDINGVNGGPIPNVVQPESIVIKNVNAPMRTVKALNLAADNAVNTTVVGKYIFDDINSVELGFTALSTNSMVTYRPISAIGQTNIDFVFNRVTNGMTNIGGTVRGIAFTNCNVQGQFTPTLGTAGRIACKGCNIIDTSISTTNMWWDYSDCEFRGNNSVGGRVASCLGSRAVTSATNERANVDTLRNATYYKV